MTQESLEAEVADAIILYEKTIKHWAGRTRQMIEEYGVIKALSRLVKSAELQQGFKALRDAKRLESTFEAIAVRHAKLFHADAVGAAKWRLENPDKLL
jgi:endonuclease III-like uncharacterized protein